MKALHVYPSDNQEQALIAFLEKMGISYSQEEELPEFVLNGISRGLDDIGDGRTVSLEQFKKQRSTTHDIRSHFNAHCCRDI